MEYFRSDDGQIQADIAYRLGRIILQYENISLNSNEKFESTLYLTVLQNVLTNCIELLNSLSGRERKKNLIINSTLEFDNIFGLNSKQIKINTFEEKLSCDKVIRHIRNAICHPTKIDIESDFCSTGYATITNDKNTIGEYCFISSPDTKSNRPKEFINPNERIDFINKQGNFPKEIKVIKTNNGKYKYQLYEKDYGRIFKIVLTSSELRKLTLSICNYLAQPIQKHWDGETIIELIAA